MKEEIARRLGVTHQWAQMHAQRSSRPSTFLDRYETSLAQAKATHGELGTLIDYSDPIRLAAEIEALAAWRRVQAWHSGHGLVKGYVFAA